MHNDENESDVDWIEIEHRLKLLQEWIEISKCLNITEDDFHNSLPMNLSESNPVEVSEVFETPQSVIS